MSVASYTKISRQPKYFGVILQYTQVVVINQFGFNGVNHGQCSASASFTACHPHLTITGSHRRTSRNEFDGVTQNRQPQGAAAEPTRMYSRRVLDYSIKLVTVLRASTFALFVA